MIVRVEDVQVPVEAYVKFVLSSYLDEFWSELLASQGVNFLQIKLNAQSFRQQQDGATRRAGGRVIKVHRHFRLLFVGSANQLA